MGKMTKHAETRCHQRGIPERVVDLIVEFGADSPRPGNASAVRIPRKNRMQLATIFHRLGREIERSKGTIVISSDSGEILTVYQ